MTLAEVLDQLRRAQAVAERGCTCSHDPEWGYTGRCVRNCDASNLKQLNVAVKTFLRWVSGEEAQ